MILQRLAEHYDRLAADPDAGATLPRAGYSLQKVSFCVVLNPDGSLIQFQDLRDQDGPRMVPRRLLVPGSAKPSGSGITPGFLWDNANYLLGVTFDEDPRKAVRARAGFAAFRELHDRAASTAGSPALSAVAAFLNAWSLERASAHPELKEITSHFGVFRIAGPQQFVHEDTAVIAWWHRKMQGHSAGPAGTCLVSGIEGPIARLHEPRIKPVRGAQAAGALLVSFNEDAYESYGKEQSINAPVSEEVAFKYANALNHLLLREDRRMLLGDATVVFWAEARSQLETFVSDLFTGVAPDTDGGAESAEQVRQLRLFVSQLRSGAASQRAVSATDMTRFFVLGLSPNAARLSVRIWLDATVQEMEVRLEQHLRDIELVGLGEDEPPLSLRRVVEATGRHLKDKRFEAYDGDSVSPLLAGAIAQAVLTGGSYPTSLLTAMLGRIRADGYIGHTRVAAIKAFLTRNSRLRGRGKEVSVTLDRNRSETGYLMGRLFAVLEKAQKDSVEGELNATIKDRYYSAASATPGVVFPRLLRLSQHHLAKLNPGHRVVVERQICEVVSQLASFPSHLDLQAQGLFAIGYYHQNKDLYTRKPTEEDLS